MASNRDTLPQSTLGIWLSATRPKTLWAAVGPVLMGIAIAVSDGAAHWPSALVALLTAILIQIGTNFANDYYDFVKGADTSERKGPVRATQAGLVSPTAMKVAFILVFALAFLMGLYLVYRAGWPILAIGIFSILFGILYTGGPYPLGYNGLADIFVLIFFGPIAVGGTYYVQALSIYEIPLIAGLAPGLISTALLTVNNLRDIETDRLAGKRTLAVRFGAGFARAEYLFCILVALMIPVGLALYLQGHYFVMWTVILLLPVLPDIKLVFNKKSSAVALNRVLGRTGRLLFLYGLIFSIGWVAGNIPR